VILIPGGDLGAGTLRFAGRYLSTTLKDTQVWAMERREQDLADYSRMGSPSRLDYYLEDQYRRETGETAAYTRGWGLAGTIADLSRMVQAARDGGRRRVFLGGHSWGATIALAYAAWDFGGNTGYKNLSGLILVDGGVHDAWEGEGYKFRFTPNEVAQKLEGLKSGNPFTGDLDYFWQLQAPPETAPLIYQLAAIYALSDPHGRSLLQGLLPKPMQPNVALTNAALLGWLIDTHAPAPDLQAHSGHVSDDPRHDWVSEGPANITDIATAFAGTQPAAVEWYWPRRLSLDLEVIDPFVPSDSTRMLDLPISHAAEIDVPLYVFETGLTHGTVVDAAKWLVAHSRIRKAKYVSDEAMSHLDPLFDSPPRNAFLRTVVVFIHSP
jgi:pimeloyl-ACP methyl ester carboxylesterase